MAFRFKLGEPFDEGCRRIAVEQIERAQILLQGKGDQAIAVHETRKSLKRLRALLRLIRPAMGEEAFKAENGQLRDVGLSRADIDAEIRRLTPFGRRWVLVPREERGDGGRDVGRPSRVR